MDMSQSKRKPYVRQMKKKLVATQQPLYRIHGA